MQVNLRPRKLFQLSGQAVVVWVDVGDHNLFNVPDIGADCRQLSPQGVESLGDIPAGVNEKKAFITFTR